MARSHTQENRLPLFVGQLSTTLSNATEVGQWAPEVGQCAPEVGRWAPAS